MFTDCLYKLRTRLRPREKLVHAGGVHYPTLIVTNHQHPPVSASGAAWCWLDNRGVGPNGLSASRSPSSLQAAQGLGLGGFGFIVRVDFYDLRYLS